MVGLEQEKATGKCVYATAAADIAHFSRCYICTSPHSGQAYVYINAPLQKTHCGPLVFMQDSPRLRHQQRGGQRYPRSMGYTINVVLVMIQCQNVWGEL